MVWGINVNLLARLSDIHATFGVYDDIFKRYCPKVRDESCRESKQIFQKAT